MSIQEVEQTIVKWFKEPHLFPRHKQSFDWRLKYFSILCHRMQQKIGQPFDTYINYIYRNWYDILYLYEVCVVARRYNTKNIQTILDYARGNRLKYKARQETENFRCQLDMDVTHLAKSG